MINRKLNIAMLGSRGIPNLYGGFEECAHQLGIRLSSRGHDVSVYTSHDHPMKDKLWNGIQRILVWNPEKQFGTTGQFIYDLNANIHSRKQNYDIVLHLGYTSDSVWYWLWPKKSAHLINMDGQEWKRQKYSRPVKRFLRYAERLAAKPGSWLIADSRIIEKYLEENYKNPVRYISYGAEIPKSYSMEFITEKNLESYKYDLMVARMEPENNIELAIKAKIKTNDNIPLIIVGNANRHKKYLLKTYQKENKIWFEDAIYKPEHINSLRHYCRLYIHGHSVGGTNPSLLEAMACSCPVAAHKNPFNEEVLGKDAIFFSSEYDLRNIFKSFKRDEAIKWIENNLEKIKQNYNWEKVTEAYEKLFWDAIHA